VLPPSSAALAAEPLSSGTTMGWPSAAAMAACGTGGGCGLGEEGPTHACGAPGSRQSLEVRVLDALSGRQGTDLLLSEREAARALLTELRETLAASRREAEEAVSECARLRTAKDQLEAELLRVTQERDTLRGQLNDTRGVLDDREEEVSHLRSFVKQKRPL